jgi:hypothetical protein
MSCNFLVIIPQPPRSSQTTDLSLDWVDHGLSNTTGKFHGKTYSNVPRIDCARPVLYALDV